MEDIFQKIGNSYTLSQRIVQQIENLIREKKLLAGQKLPTEKELCENFSVSRTAIREALQVLSAKGLIKGNGGLFIGASDGTEFGDANDTHKDVDVTFHSDAAYKTFLGYMDYSR